MEITEVKVFLRSGARLPGASSGGQADTKLKAYATVTFDHCFVVRNIKVIQGTQGLFVAMPSRKMTTPCGRCGHRNEVRARHCSQCGAPQEARAPQPTASGEREPEHRDLAHPITSEFRATLQAAILKAYEEELTRGGSQPPLPHSHHEEVGE